jgi:hypothetical protein
VRSAKKRVVARATRVRGPRRSVLEEVEALVHDHADSDWAGSREHSRYLRRVKEFKKRKPGEVTLGEPW